MTSSPRQVAVVLNPSKRDAEVVRRRIIDAATSRGDRVVLYETTVAQPGAAQARLAVADGAGLVIAAGGDGTVREVALGLCGSGVPLGIVPVGTANLFARNLGLRPRDREQAIRTALTAAPRPLDCGLARFEYADGRVTQHAFLVLAGVGNDAATVLGTRDRLKERFGWLAYAESAVRHVTRRPIAMTVRSDSGDDVCVTAWSVVAGNCGRIPAGLVLFPRARLDDGLLDTMVVTAGRVGQWVAVGLKGLLRLPDDVPGITMGRVRELRITPSRPTPAQLDGDVFADVTRVDLGVEHRALRVCLPPDRSRRRRDVGNNSGKSSDYHAE